MFATTLTAKSANNPRSVIYLPYPPVGDELADGKLIVNEDTGVRVRRTVTRTYLIQEQYACCGDRMFLVVKDSDAGRLDLAAGRAGLNRIGDVYECRIPTTSGRKPSCTCTAGVTRGACIHAEALATVVASGELPSAMESGSDR